MIDKVVTDKDSEVSKILSNVFILLKFKKNNVYKIKNPIKMEIINFHISLLIMIE